jgi:hypothetical protein
MLKAVLTGAVFLALMPVPSPAQDTEVSVSVPVTMSGGTLYSQRLQLSEPDASPAAAAFRAVLYPTVRLGPNWFGYAAVQVRSMPYLYYDAFEREREVKTDTLQAYIGYSFRKDKLAMVIKAGKLSSAFGSFPLHYDDAENPLLDQPLSYITYLPINTRQFPCGTSDLVRQRYGGASFGCGPVLDEREEGPVPVTLYGLPGVQAEISSGRVDARLQLTSGSPANPRAATTVKQSLTWTLGGGYTIHQGLRVGMSGFRGPYLDREVSPFLPIGTTVRDFPETGLGVDAQWAHGRWSVSGEFQRFRFNSPNFKDSPSVTSGYVEAKTVLTPRLYVAGRAAYLYAGRVVDRNGVSADQFTGYLRSYELGAGCWITRNQLLKGSYEWLRPQGFVGRRLDVLGFQYVMQFHSLAWAFNR